MPTKEELKAELRKHGLSTAGLKDALQRRLADHQAATQGGSAPSSRPASPASPSVSPSPSPSAPDLPAGPDLPTLLLGETPPAPALARTRTPSSLIGFMHKQKTGKKLTHEEKSRQEQVRQYNEKVYQQRLQPLGSPGKGVQKRITKFKLIKMFEEVDEDGNGTLDKEEVKKVLCMIKSSETVDGDELTVVMNDLNPSGTGEVTQAEFLNYFERHRESGAGIIGRYFAQKKKTQGPTISERIQRQARQHALFIRNRAALPLKIAAAAGAVFMYWTLITDHAYEDTIVRRAMLLPLSWVGSNSSVETVGHGFREMSASLDKCKGDVFDTPSIDDGDHQLLQELETHAELFLNRLKCFDKSFQHTIEISESTGVMSVSTPPSDGYAAWVLQAIAPAGWGIVETSVLIGILQVFLFVAVLRLVEHFCAAAFKKSVGTELWSKLRDAHFENSCKSMFAELDLNRDGHVSRTELGCAFHSSPFQPPVSDAELDNIIAHADANNNGSIEYSEFRPVWYATRGTEVLPELKQAFMAFDRDENGFASITEFRDVMQQLDEPYKCEPNDEELQAMADLADVDMDGQVDYDEFVKMMLCFPSRKKEWYWPVLDVLKQLHPQVQKWKWTALWVWVVFSATPPIMWLAKLIGICSQFDQESVNIAEGLNELLQNLIGSRDSDFSCEYRTFGFKIAALVKWVVVDLYEGISGVGVFGAICGLPTAYEMWTEHQNKLAKEKEQQLQDAQTLERDFMEVVQFSLCKMQRGEFSYTTMFEMTLKELVKGKKAVLDAVNQAAEKATPQYGLLHTMGKKDWEQVRGMILNTLSEKYSDGYVAEELGMGAQKAMFWFCLVNESGSTTKKLRVIVARDKMLKEAKQCLEEGIEPTFPKSYFKSRWGTVKNMAILLSERKEWKNAPMRDIELALPFHMEDPQQTIEGA